MNFVKTSGTVLLGILLTNSAFAEGGAAGGLAPLMQFLPFILMFVVVYFLIIRPQKKRDDECKDFINKLTKGSEVLTNSGILGTVTGINDNFVTLEVSDNTRIKVLKTAIAGSLKDALQNEQPAK